MRVPLDAVRDGTGPVTDLTVVASHPARAHPYDSVCLWTTIMRVAIPLLVPRGEKV